MEVLDEELDRTKKEQIYHTLPYGRYDSSQQLLVCPIGLSGR
jgi:hypothetical protein